MIVNSIFSYKLSFIPSFTNFNFLYMKFIISDIFIYGYFVHGLSYRCIHDQLKSYGRVFCLESQKIDGTEYLRGSTDFEIFFILLNLEAWNLAGLYKIEYK